MTDRQHEIAPLTHRMNNTILEPHKLTPFASNLLSLYRTMARIRAFENAAEVASQGGVSAYGKSADGSAKVRGPLHLSTGQEAVPAGVCVHLGPKDYIIPSQRAQAWNA